MISTNSRYRTSQVIPMAVGDQLRQTIVPGQQIDWSFTFTWHTVKLGERVDHLGRRYFNDESAWWNIADANPEVLDWMTLVPGTLLRIPNV